MHREADWPFDDPPDLAVITSRSIISGDAWIAFVSHDEDDGGWQFHPSEPISVDDAAVVALRTILDKDGTIESSRTCRWVGKRGGRAPVRRGKGHFQVSEKVNLANTGD